MAEKGKLTVKLDEAVGKINQNIYGHFIEHLGRCVYSGIWVGENSEIPNELGLRNDVVKALKAINPPVFRWPGGCFADFYHWEDGVGPVENRPRRVNLWWGGVETNEFGTDEFLCFCSLIKAEPYVCLNVGSGSLKEAASWVEYCNYSGESSYARFRAENGHPEPYKVKYWGVGNENWGCGGSFDPVYYAWEYRRFATYLKRFDPSIRLIACGHTSRDWNLRFMETLRDQIHLIDYLSIHYYFGNPKRYGGDIDFTDTQYLNLLSDVQNLEQLLKQTIRIVDFFSEGRKEIGIAVDEWGVWHPQATIKNGLYQQNTLRDAILAAVVLNLFNRFSKKVKMANIAQTVNVLQSLCLTKGEEMVLTPTYHVYAMYQSHMGNTALRSEVSSPAIKESESADSSWMPKRKHRPLQALDASASLSKDRKHLVITLVNQSLNEDLEMEVCLIGNNEVETGELTILNAEDVRIYNDFGYPNKVVPRKEPFEAEGRTLKYTALKHSVTLFLLTLK